MILIRLYPNFLTQTSAARITPQNQVRSCTPEYNTTKVQLTTTSYQVKGEELWGSGTNEFTKEM